MQQAIDDTRNITSKYQNCGALIGSNFKYGQNLIIDTSVFIDHRYHHKNTNIKYNLDSIAKIITMNDTNYILVGVVHYTQYGNINSGHYIAYALTGIH